MPFRLFNVAAALFVVLLGFQQLHYSVHVGEHAAQAAGQAQDRPLWSDSESGCSYCAAVGAQTLHSKTFNLEDSWRLETGIVSEKEISSNPLFSLRLPPSTGPPSTRT